MSHSEQETLGPKHDPEDEKDALVELKSGSGAAPMGLFSLPEEVQELILVHLDVRDLVACSQVCRLWRVGINSSRIWKKWCVLESYKPELLEQCPTHMFVENGEDSLSMGHWRMVYGWHEKLRHNWKTKSFNRYKLAQSSSHVYCCDTNGEVAATGHEDSSVTIWSIKSVPFVIASLRGVLNEFPILTVRVDKNLVVVQQRKLLQVFHYSHEKYHLRDLKSFEMGEGNIEQMEFYSEHGPLFSSWYEECLRAIDKTTVPAPLIFNVFRNSRTFGEAWLVNHVTPKVDRGDSASGQNGTLEEFNTRLVYAIFHQDPTPVYRNLLFASSHHSGIVRVWTLPGSEICISIETHPEVFQIVADDANVFFITRDEVTHLLRYDEENQSAAELLSVPGLKKLIVGDELVAALPSPGDVTLKRIWAYRKGDYSRPIGTRTITGYSNVSLCPPHYVVYSEDKTVTVWDPVTGNTVSHFGTDAMISSLRPAFSSFLLIFMGTSLHVWDWKTGVRLYRLYSGLEWTGNYGNLLWANASTILSGGVDHQLEMVSFM